MSGSYSDILVARCQLPAGSPMRREWTVVVLSPTFAAVLAAFRHSAAALTESAIVCGLGILVFAGSSFAPSRRFAWMLSLLVAAALVGDLVVLPALLASPLGRFFRPASRPRP